MHAAATISIVQQLHIRTCRKRRAPVFSPVTSPLGCCCSATTRIARLAGAGRRATGAIATQSRQPDRLRLQARLMLDRADMADVRAGGEPDSWAKRGEG
jgi:hypothetical protein